MKYMQQLNNNKIVTTQFVYYRAKALIIITYQAPSAKADCNLSHNFTVCFTDCVKIGLPN